jgi:hypothetical protein
MSDHYDLLVRGGRLIGEPADGPRTDGRDCPMSSYPVISADSHITEPPNVYSDNIAPKMVTDEKAGDLFIVDGMSRPIPMGLVAAAAVGIRRRAWTIRSATVCRPR